MVASIAGAEAAAAAARAGKGHAHEEAAHRAGVIAKDCEGTGRVVADCTWVSAQHFLNGDMTKGRERKEEDGLQ